MLIGLGVGSFGGKSPLTVPTELPAWVATDNLFDSPSDLSTWWTRGALGTHATTTGYAGQTASVMVENGTTANHQVSRSMAFTEGLTYIMRGIVKIGTGSRDCQCVLPSAAFGSTVTARFTLSGAGVEGATANTPTVNIERLYGDHYLVSMQKSATASASGTVAFRIGAASYAGDGTSSLIVTALGLHVVT
jgi:hypothetical protein